MDGLSPNQFQGVQMNDIPFVEDLLTLNIVLYDIDIVDGNIIGELARRSLQKYNNTVRLLRYNNHICYVSNINAIFQDFGCAICDTFFNRTFNLERHLFTCSERVKNVYPRNVYQIRETPFDKLDPFGIKYTSQQKLFKNLANSILNQFVSKRALQRHKDNNVDRYACTDFSIHFFKLCGGTNFLYNSDPNHLVLSFSGTLEGLASQSEAQVKLLFLVNETTIKIKLANIMKKLTQPHNRRKPADLDDCDNEICASTQFLQLQKIN